MTQDERFMAEALWLAETAAAEGEVPIGCVVVKDDRIVGQRCPLCGKGTIIKGKTAYGCSNWKAGCTFRQPFGTPPADSGK